MLFTHAPQTGDSDVGPKYEDRDVYDASVKASPNAPSLNECLYPGPPLQKSCGMFLSVIVPFLLLYVEILKKHSCKFESSSASIGDVMNTPRHQPTGSLELCLSSHLPRTS